MSSTNDRERPTIPFSVLAKPAGAACNLDCSYCFYLSKELLHDETSQRMTDETLSTHLRELFAAHPDGDVTVAWQGGEPTLRGLDFFRRVVAMAEKYRRPEQRAAHVIQTNGTLITDEWATFLKDHNFLVGLSIDGPAHLHDEYRTNRAGRGTHKQVIRGWDALQRAGVDVNILCTVNSNNAAHPLEIYTYFRDNLGARYLQFIPIVERVPAGMKDTAERSWHDGDGNRVLYTQDGDGITSRTIDPAEWGTFLSTIFDEWVTRDVGDVFVQHFDSTLGNIADSGFAELLQQPEQRAFGRSKRTSMPAQCVECPVRWACNGGCPKDRFRTTDTGEPGLNYLCEGYHKFFSHVQPAVGTMATLLRSGRPADLIMTMEH